MNKVNLVGRVTKDIELRATKNGTQVSSFYLAINKQKKEDGTDFIPCVAWGKTAELLSKYISRGDRIGVSGRINTRSYEDKNKKTVYVTEVVVEELYFFESKKTANNDKLENAPTGEDDGFPF